MMGIMFTMNTVSNVMVFITISLNIDKIAGERKKLTNIFLTSRLLNNFGLFVASSILIYMFWGYAISVN